MEGCKNLYLGVVSVDPNKKSCGYMRAMLEAMTGDCAYVVTRTQNPAVINSMYALYGNVIPLTDPRRHLEYLDYERALAIKVADETGTAGCFNPKTFVFRGVYNGESLTGPKASNHQPTGKIGDKILDLINPSNGDAIIAISRVDYTKLLPRTGHNTLEWYAKQVELERLQQFEGIE
jgi:hypothetical protein